MSCDRSAPTGEKTLMSHWRGIMLTKGAIGNLINRYRAVLKKCNLMNVFGSLAVAGMLVMGGAGMAIADERPIINNNTVVNGQSVSGQTSTSWGGVYYVSNSGSLTLNNSHYSDNVSKGSGGVLLGEKNQAVLNVDSSSFSNNKALYDGGAISNFGFLSVTDSTFEGNRAQMEEDGSHVTDTSDIGGGAIGIGSGSHVSIAGSTFVGNISGKDGGAIATRKFYGSYDTDFQDVGLSIKNSTFSGNEAGRSVSGNPYNYNNNVTGLHESGNGGALFNTFTDTKVESSVFTGNSAINGGAIANFYDHGKTQHFGSITITGSQFVENKATANENISDQFDNGFGGAIYTYIDARAENDESHVVITTSSFTQNSATHGGAVANRAKLEVSNSKFTGNTALQTGGAIYNGTDLTFSGTNTFDNNTAAGTANDIHNKGTLTVASGVTDLNSGYTQEGENSQLNVATGGVLSIAMPDKGGVNANSNEALLALGQQLDLSKGGKLHVGDVNNSTAGVAFGSNSVFVVDGKIASEIAMIKGSGSLTVEDGSQLYIANAKANTPYTITQGLTGDSYWDEANLLANRLIKATVSKDDDAVMVKTEVKDVASALPGVIPVAGLTTMLAQNLNDTDSGFMGVRFLSRATEPLYMSDDGKAVATINEVSRAAVTAGVQNASLRLSDAASDTVLHHLSLGNFDSGNSIHQNGWDIWATPMYGNTYTHGMSASGASVRGNYGGLAIGADTQVGTLAGGNVRMGAAINGGGGKSETSGTATDTENSYNFGGVNLYAGWNLDNLNIMAALGYSMGSHDVKMNLPASLGMGQAKADVDSHAFTADLRAEYQFKTDWLDILPHAGVRYTALHTDGYDLKVNGSTLNSVDSDTQNIVQFPIGVTVTKNIDVAGWNIKPQADVSVIPAAGDKKASTKVSFSGIDAADSVNTRIMDSTSWAGMLGIQAEKGNLALGLNYGVQASRHETDQKVQFNIGWKF